jgi:Rod binding domain-containing protein
MNTEALPSGRPELVNRLAAQPGLQEAPHGKAQETAAQHKLRQAAGQFESMLLADLWKSMKSTFEDDDGESADPAHGAMDELGMEAMSSAVGKAGGLGIGKLIVQHLEPKIRDSHVGKGAPKS